MDGCIMAFVLVSKECDAVVITAGFSGDDCL